MKIEEPQDEKSDVMNRQKYGKENLEEEKHRLRPLIRFDGRGPFPVNPNFRALADVTQEGEATDPLSQTYSFSCS